MLINVLVLGNSVVDVCQEFLLGGLDVLVACWLGICVAQLLDEHIHTVVGLADESRQFAPVVLVVFKQVPTTDALHILLLFLEGFVDADEASWNGSLDLIDPSLLDGTVRNDSRSSH